MGSPPAEASPYRENAYRAPVPVRRRWPHVVACAIGLVAAASIATAMAWCCTSWKRTVELRTTKEDMPSHSPIAAIWWNREGTLAVAVGSAGDVFRRTNELGEVGKARWERLESDAHEALLAVAGGDGPWLPGRRLGQPVVERVFAVGARGTFVDCTPRRASQGCVAVHTESHETFRAIAMDGGQAIVVGDHGVILHAQGDARVYREPRDGALAIERVEIPGLNADLDFVALHCSADAAAFTCTAIAGAKGLALARGVGEGRCADGSYPPRTSTECHWTWSLVDRPESQPSLDERVAPAPVHVIATRLWARRERQNQARVPVDGVARGSIDGLPIGADMRFVGGAWPAWSEGDVALLIGEDGAIYLAR